jgi:hypothetical protein
MEVEELILWMRRPEWTPAFQALHDRIAAAKTSGELTDALLNECSDCECLVCGAIICPFSDLLHFHHDGCPTCDTMPVVLD